MEGSGVTKSIWIREGKAIYSIIPSISHLQCIYIFAGHGYGCAADLRATISEHAALWAGQCLA